MRRNINQCYCRLKRFIHNPDTAPRAHYPSDRCAYWRGGNQSEPAQKLGKKARIQICSNDITTSLKFQQLSIKATLRELFR
jgi:hypothetical protein